MNTLSDKRVKKIISVAKQRLMDITLVLIDIHDPHNAAAILRSADAFGIQTIQFVFEKETPYDPSVFGKSTSSSANKWLTFITYSSVSSCFADLKKEHFTIMATVADPSSESIYNSHLSEGKIAVVFGNEKDGLSKAAIDQSDRQITIPMRGMVQSLNVSVTAGILLYEVTRQRKDKVAKPHELEYKRTLAMLLEKANK